MHHNKDIKFANLNERELDKLREAEKFINTQKDQNTEEIILLAYKQDKK
jgi:hypothetical protein